LVPPLCNAISVTSERLKEINILSITSLKTVIKKCWPRIPYYNGIIMKAIARCWLYYYSKNDDEMSSLIKELYVLFEAACDGKERADKEALIAFRGDIFNPLFV
ncbi:hypothetical protein BDF20DRAFT_804289, partial [Mycotypha africana]|uniref:uncharacterized protein n=1 Tax=Mycotypha africana TaxID=64632 RepID=UPI0022FFFD4C